MRTTGTFSGAEGRYISAERMTPSLIGTRTLNSRTVVSDREFVSDSAIVATLDTIIKLVHISHLAGLAASPKQRPNWHTTCEKSGMPLGNDMGIAPCQPQTCSNTRKPF